MNIEMYRKILEKIESNKLFKDSYKITNINEEKCAFLNTENNSSTRISVQDILEDKDLSSYLKNPSRLDKISKYLK